MFFYIASTLRARAAEAGQSKAEFVLIVAPLSVMLALAVCTVILAGSK